MPERIDSTPDEPERLDSETLRERNIYICDYCRGLFLKEGLVKFYIPRLKFYWLCKNCRRTP